MRHETAEEVHTPSAHFRRETVNNITNRDSAVLGDNYKKQNECFCRSAERLKLLVRFEHKKTLSEKSMFWLKIPVLVTTQTQLKTPRLPHSNICFVLLPQTSKSCGYCANTHYPVVSHAPANKAATGPTAVRVITLDIFNDTCRHFQLFLRQNKRTAVFLKRPEDVCQPFLQRQNQVFDGKTCRCFQM